MRQLTHGIPQGGLPAGITRGQDGKFVTPFGAYDTLEEAVTVLRMNPSTGGFNPPPEPAMAQQPPAKPPVELMVNPYAVGGGFDKTAPAAPEANPNKPMGLLDRLKSGFSGIKKSDAMMALGAGMLGLSNDPNLQKIGMGGFDQLGARRQGNRTLDFLRSKGVDEATLKSLQDNPQLISAYASSLLTPAKDTALKQNYEYAKTQGFTGSFTDFMNLNKSGTTINVGADTDELRKKLQGKEGEAWAGFLAAGNKAAELAGDLDLMQQLASASPTGALSGRFLEMFPEANDNAAAFQALVKRIAPTMRVEGSGSTSDIEVKMMLDSLGSLRNSPEANGMIYDAFRKKFALNQARAEIVTKFNAGEYSYTQASSKLNEINRISIMPEGLKELTKGAAGAKPTGSITKPEWIDPALWDVMSDEQKQRMSM